MDPPILRAFTSTKGVVFFTAVSKIFKGSFKVFSLINENVSKLNETQTKVLDLFIENDNKKINEYYQNLITETTELVDQKVIKSDNVDVAKRLLEVKIKLNNLKSETPSVSEIEKIVSLKESFS